MILLDDAFGVLGKVFCFAETLLAKTSARAMNISQSSIQGHSWAEECSSCTTGILTTGHQ